MSNSTVYIVDSKIFSFGTFNTFLVGLGRNQVFSYQFKLMCRSCYLYRTLNVEISVEYRKIFVVVFFNVAAKCILGHLQDFRKGWAISLKTCRAIRPSSRSSRKKVNKHFKIRRQLQYLMTRPNDMIHT